MPITIFIHGCNCGQTAKLVSKVRQYAKKAQTPFELKNSRYDQDLQFDHLNWLRLNSMETDSYQPIVVEDNKVVPLSSWHL